MTTVLVRFRVPGAIAWLGVECGVWGFCLELAHLMKPVNVTIWRPQFGGPKPLNGQPSSYRIRFFPTWLLKSQPTLRPAMCTWQQKSIWSLSPSLRRGPTWWIACCPSCLEPQIHPALKKAQLRKIDGPDDPIRGLILSFTALPLFESW